MKRNRNKLTLIAGATLALGTSAVLGGSDAHARGFTVLGTAGQVRSALLDSQNSVIDGQYAAETASEDKSGEGKCGEGKCGEGEDKDKDGKKDEHKSAGEGKCGEGKCGS